MDCPHLEKYRLLSATSECPEVGACEENIMNYSLSHQLLLAEGEASCNEAED